jgi:hypothetical protein
MEVEFVKVDQVVDVVIRKKKSWWISSPAALMSQAA